MPPHPLERAGGWPISAFYPKRRNNGKMGLTSKCRQCILAKMRRPITPRDCAHCRERFTPASRSDTKFCSVHCQRTARARAKGKRPRASVVDGQKRCNTCGIRKPVEDFYPRADRRGAPISHCRPCVMERTRSYNASSQGLGAYLRRSYGLTPADLERMTAAQGGRCAICSRAFGEVPRHIDHDHQTGKVRGLLCGGCNVALGLLQDDPTVVAAAAAYLVQHKAVAA